MIINRMTWSASKINMKFSIVAVLITFLTILPCQSLKADIGYLASAEIFKLLLEQGSPGINAIMRLNKLGSFKDALKRPVAYMEIMSDFLDHFQKEGLHGQKGKLLDGVTPDMFKRFTEKDFAVERFRDLINPPIGDDVYKFKRDIKNYILAARIFKFLASQGNAGIEALNAFNTKGGFWKVTKSDPDQGASIMRGFAAGRRASLKPHHEIVVSTLNKVFQGGNQDVSSDLEYLILLAVLTDDIEASPKDPEMFFARGNFFIQNKKFDRAISDYTKAIDLNPQFVLAYHNRSAAHELKGDLKKAIVDMEQCVKLNPENSDYLSRLNKIKGQAKK